MLVGNGLFEREADAVMEALIAGSSPAIRWQDDVSGYPPSVIAVLWISARRKAVEYIDANCPRHWARPLLDDVVPKHHERLATAKHAEG